MSSTRSLFFVVASVCLIFAQAASAQGHRRLLDSKAREVKAVTEEAEASGRQLYIDPTKVPTSTKGWNVALSIISDGKYSSVNNIKLRTAISALGFPTDGANFQFGGNAATTNWRSIAGFVINVPTATSGTEAINAVKAKITVKALNAIAKLPNANPVKQILFSAFKA